MHDTLREVIYTLAAIERGSGSSGETRAADWLAARLTQAGARDAHVEQVEYHHGYAGRMAALSAAGVTAAAAALKGHRIIGTVLATAAAAAIVDDASNGPRVLRRRSPPRTTTNVIAETGDHDAAITLVVLAHHDAAPTGQVFDQTLQKAVAHKFPDIIAKIDTSIPLWWLVGAGPMLAALGSLTGRRGMLKTSIGLSGLGVAAFSDVARSPIVPGANDNLSAVAVLVALAEDGDFPVRVILASCGAEEVVQGGIYAFAAQHLSQLDPDRTYVLNHDTVGSPQLFMLEGEGTFKMQEYTDPSFRDKIAAAAETCSGPLRRGCRARSSTDAVIPSRLGFPTATLCSWEPDTKCLSNYHLMTDTAENIDYDTVARAVAVTAQLARDLGH